LLLIADFIQSYQVRSQKALLVLNRGDALQGKADLRRGGSGFKRAISRSTHRHSVGVQLQNAMANPDSPVIGGAQEQFLLTFQAAPQVQQGFESEVKRHISLNRQGKKSFNVFGEA
jgi:hypothetical protein